MEETDSDPRPGDGDRLPEVLSPPGGTAMLCSPTATHLLRPHRSCGSVGLVSGVRPFGLWKQKCDEGGGGGGGVRDELEHFFKWFQFSGRQEGVLVPHVVRCCVEEVERRGMDEVGIYRISGSAIDISKLKAAFNSSKTANNLADAIFVENL